MDFWFVAVRGEEDALVEARAILGAPVAWFETLQLFSFEAVDPRNAANWVSSIAQTQGLAGAVVLSGDDSVSARERALALACAAPDGRLLFDHAAHLRLDSELMFERATSRPGWSIPVESAALARENCRRADARVSVAKIPTEFPFIGRDNDVDALVRMLGAPEPVWLVADEGAGGGRLVQEAARRAEKLFARIPLRAMQSEALLDAAIADAVGDWIVLDPIGPEHLPQVSAIASRFPRVRRLVIRAPRNVGIEFIGPSRQFSLAPLTVADSRKLARAALGEHVGEPWIRRIARRGHGLPGQIIEVARAAVQLGHITWDGESFRPRVHRVLNRRGTTGDPIDDRVRDVPDRARRALSIIATLGDGAPEIAGSAALRGTMTSRPDEFTTQLLSLRLVHVRDAQLWIDASVRRFLPPSDVAADTLIEKGVLPSASEAEQLLSMGKLRDAGSLFVEAAAMALEAGLSAAAVRFIAAALPNGGHDAALADELLGAVKTIARTLGPAVVIQPEGGRGGRAMDPEALEQAAQHAVERNDMVGAERLRALAEVVRGNSQNALRITGRHSSDGSSKSQLVSAIALASAGEMRVAVRTALRALLVARRASDRSGEAAALAVLSSMYKAAGREDDARRLAAGAKHLQQAS
jgi:hypothetical protein